jgi:hypothetical protein
VTAAERPAAGGLEDQRVGVGHIDGLDGKVVFELDREAGR